MAQLHKNLTLTLGLISVLILASCKVNGYRNGLKHGLWINKDVDGEITQKSSGKFKNETEIGIWNTSMERFFIKKKNIMELPQRLSFITQTKRLWPGA